MMTRLEKVDLYVKRVLCKSMFDDTKLFIVSVMGMSFIFGSLIAQISHLSTIIGGVWTGWMGYHLFKLIKRLKLEKELLDWHTKIVIEELEKKQTIENCR